MAIDDLELVPPKERRDPAATAPPRQSAFADYPGPVIVISPTGDVSAGNDEATPFLAPTSDGQLGDLILAGQAIRRREPVPETMLRALDAGGRTLAYAFTLVPLPNSAGVVAFGRDVGHETVQRDRLLSITRSLRLLLDFSCQFAWETDQDGRLSFIAPRNVIGFHANKLAGRNPAEIFGQTPLVEVIRVFSAREAVRNVLLKGIAGDGKPIDMLARAHPIFAASGEWIGARGVLNYVAAEDERRFAADRGQDFASALADLKRLFANPEKPHDCIQQTCTQAADLLNSAGTAAYILDPRSAEFRRVASHGPVDEDAVDLCARPFLERLTDGRARVDGRKYRRQILTAASRSERNLVGAFVCWREEAEDPWTDVERNFAQDIANLQTAALGEVLRQAASAAVWKGSSAGDLAKISGSITTALAGRARAGEEPSLLCLTIDNIDGFAASVARARVDDLIGMFGLIIRRAAGDGLVAQLEQDEYVVWLPTGGTPRARTVAEACLKMVDPLRGTNHRTKLGLSIGIAIVTPGRFQTFESLQNDALQGARISRQSGGHSYTFI